MRIGRGIAPISRLGRPFVVFAPAAATKQQQQIETVLAQVRRRPTKSVLRPPIFYPATSETSVTLVAVRTRAELGRRGPRSRLTPPTALQVFAGPQVTRAVEAALAQQRRGPQSKLAPPATLEPESVQLEEETIRVTLAAARRPSFGSALAPPTAVQSFMAAPTVRVALVRARPQPTHSRLAQPVFTPAKSTIRVALAGRTRTEVQRRSPHSRLAPPRFYPVASVIDTTLAGRTRGEAVRRAPHSKLRPSVVVAPVAPTLEQQTVMVILAWRTRVELVRRVPRSVLRPPLFVKATSVISTTLVQIRPRRIRALLGKPTALLTFPGPEVTLAPARRPQPHSKLRPPTVIARAFTALPSLAALTKIRPRPTTTRLSPPAAVTVPAVEQAEETIRVILARGRRRRGRGILAAPTVLRVFVGPRTAFAKAALVTRRTRSRLSPSAVREAIFSAALRGRTPLRPSRLSHWLLRPPTIVAERPAIQPPVRVLTVAVAARAALVRRAPRYRLEPPAPTHAKGVACLIDLPAATACLADVAAALACLADLLAAESCLDDQAEAAACLDDQSAATATIHDEKETL